MEVAGGRTPEQAILKQCLDYMAGDNAQTEYWLVGATKEQVRAHYDAFHGQDSALRFARLDLASDKAPELDAGLMRPHAAELLMLHDDAATFGPEQWRLLRRLAVPGGLALVVHGNGLSIEPDAGWTTVRAGRRTTLLQAPDLDANPPEPRRLAGPRWVIGEPDSLAAEWLGFLDGSQAVPISYSELEAGRVGALADWPGAAIWKRSTSSAAPIRKTRPDSSW